jgi:Tol biopolymer transport system component
MVQEIAGGGAIAVFEAEFYLDLRWSPDSADLLVTTWSLDHLGRTYLVPRLGGAARQFEGAGVVAWSPDGSQFAVNPDGVLQIVFHTRSGDVAREMPLSGAYKYVTAMDWSPSGSHLALTTKTDEGRSALWVVTTDGRSALKLLEDPDPGVGLFSARWSPRGDAVYYLRFADGVGAVWKLGVSSATADPTGKPALLVAGLQAGVFFNVSADGKRLLYIRDVFYSNLWLARREGSVPDKVTANQLTTGTQEDDSPSVSPDGRQVAFMRWGAQGSNIFVVPAEGGPVRQLTFWTSSNFTPVWSPDGQEIAFASTEGGTPHVWKVGAAGGTPRVFARTSPSRDLAWAPGRQIMYQVAGNQDFRLLDPASESEVPLLTNRQKEDVSAFSAKYSPDAGRVALHWNRRGRYRRGVWVIDLKSGSETLVCDGRVWPLGWSSSGRVIYALDIPLTLGNEGPNVVSVPSGGKAETFM